MQEVQFFKCNHETFTFCCECNTYLTTKIENNEASVSGCGFIWFVSKDMEVQNKYKESICIFIPTQFWPWWIRIFLYKIPNVFGNITIYRPTSAFKDQKHFIDTWKSYTNIYILSRLALSPNTYLLPIVKFPLGCSELQHKGGYLPISVVFQRYLQ